MAKNYLQWTQLGKGKIGRPTKCTMNVKRRKLNDKNTPLHGVSTKNDELLEEESEVSYTVIAIYTQNVIQAS